MVEGCGFGGLDVGVAVDGGEDVVDVHGCALGVCFIGLGRGNCSDNGSGIWWWWVDKERSGDRAEWMCA